MRYQKLRLEKKELLEYANNNRKKLAALFALARKEQVVAEYESMTQLLCTLDEMASMMDANIKMIFEQYVPALIIIAFVQVCIVHLVQRMLYQIRFLGIHQRILNRIVRRYERKY